MEAIINISGKSLLILEEIIIILFLEEIQHD